MINVEIGLTLVGSDALLADSSLLIGKELIADVIGVVGLEELLLLGGKMLQGLAELNALGIGSGIKGLDIGLDVSADVVPRVFSEFNLGVLVLDGLLDLFGSVMWLRALATLAFATDEVLVGGAVSAFGSGVDETATAVAAEETAAEVVVVTPVALT